MSDIDQVARQVGAADMQELSAQLQRHVWQLLDQTPGVLAGQYVPWKIAPHIVVDALRQVLVQIWEGLIAHDAATELPRAKQQIERLRSQLDILEAMSSSEAPRC